MRRDRQQFRFSRPQFGRASGKGVQPVGIEHHRQGSRLQHRANELLRFGIRRKPRANRQHGFAVGDLREVFAVQVAHAGGALLGGEQARGHQFGHARGHDRQHVPRRSHGGQARAHAQSGASAQHGGSRFAQRARDNQGVAKACLCSRRPCAPAEVRKIRPVRASAASARDRRPAVRAACRSRARSDGPRSRREATGVGQPWAR